MKAASVSTTEGRVVHVVLAEDGLSGRGRLAAAVLALAGLALAGLGSTWAGAPPVITDRPPVLAAGPAVTVLPLGCDGPTTHLAWDSTKYTTVELTVVGTRVATPGDRVGCTLNVTNTGPSAARMTISFVPQVTVVGAANPDLAEGLYFFWDVAGAGGTERVDTAGDGVATEVQVARGQVVPVEVGATMPAEVTGHARGGLDSTQLSFEVAVQLTELPNPPTDPPTSPPTDPPTSPPTDPPLTDPLTSPPSTTPVGSDQSSTPTDHGHKALVRSGLRLPRTGAEIVGVAAVGGGLVAAGTAIWIVVRRRRDPAAPGGTR